MNPLHQALPLRPETRLHRVERAGESASAVLATPYPDHTAHEALLLLRARGRWQVVASICHRGPPGGEPVARIPWDERTFEHHPRARTFTVIGGEAVRVTLREGRARLTRGGWRLVRVDGAGDTALVELEHEDRVMDQLLMVHERSGWRIVGRVYVPVRPGERELSAVVSRAAPGSGASPRARAR